MRGGVRALLVGGRISFRDLRLNQKAQSRVEKNIYTAFDSDYFR